MSNKVDSSSKGKKHEMYRYIQTPPAITIQDDEPKNLQSAQEEHESS